MASPPPPSYAVESAEQSTSRDTQTNTTRQDEKRQVPDEPQSDEDVPPPAYGEQYGEISEEQEGIGTNASVRNDGRVNININQKVSRLSTLLVPALRNQLELSTPGEEPPPYVPPSLRRPVSDRPLPALNVVIHVVGSRGDVQPFVALGKVLKEQHGHRVRLATHPVFRNFVQENGLEFFDILGDPSELMAFMVKNPGLMPEFNSLRSGEVGHRRKEIGKMVRRCWRSCIEPGDGSGVEASDARVDDWSSSSTANNRPFVADAIIANPPSFAHIHCAEKLGVPLHMMFTMPWSPTQAFPHPLANVQSSNADANMTNFLTYALVEMMTWQGLGDVINRFRHRSLGLEPIELTWAPGMLARLKVPYTYCWSPALIPKPRDWGDHINISGFYFLNLASNFTPEPDLAAFLAAGPPPVYIGFGSIVVDDPNAMTKLIFEAVKKSGQRALVSKGWGGFGADQIGIPEGVFMLGNVPHDWLFKHVSCVVHHGGAGTTSAGITSGKPTIIVPFFGDQPFWGAMVARAGAGPKPMPYKSLTSDALAEAIGEALKPECVEKAKDLSMKISQEKGSETGADMFHDALSIDKLRCQLSPNRVAVWRVKKLGLRLSTLAVAHLANENLLDFRDLKLYRSREYETDMGPAEPISGGASAILASMGSITMGLADLPVSALRALRIHPDSAQRKEISEADSEKKKEKRKADAEKKKQKLERQETAKEQKKLQKQERSSSQSTKSSKLTKKSKQRESSSTSTDAYPQNPEAASSSDSVESLDRTDSAAASLNSAAISSETPVHRDSDTPMTSTSTLPVDHRPDTPAAPPFRPQTPPQSTTKPAPRQKWHPEGESTNARLEAAVDTASSFGRIMSAAVKSPMDFSNALARGFSNAPKLYGDTTVRPQEKITGLSSGFRAAGKGFGYGFYDGISGLVTQPYEGARKEGAVGLIKGAGKGMGGIVLKPGAAIFGLPGYVGRGAYKEWYKLLSPGVRKYIIRARAVQGLAELEQSSEVERKIVAETWKEITRLLGRDRKPDERVVEDIRAKTWRTFHGDAVEDLARSRTGLDPAPNASESFPAPVMPPVPELPPRLSAPESHTFGAQADEVTLHESSADAQLPTSETDPPQTNEKPMPNPPPSSDPSSQARTQSPIIRKPLPQSQNPAPPPDTPEPHQTPSQDQNQDTPDADLEEAIRRSVADSSRGNPDEDAMIERAIRASVSELEHRRARKGKGKSRALDGSAAGEAASEDNDDGVDQEEAYTNPMGEIDESDDEEGEEIARALEESRMHFMGSEGMSRGGEGGHGDGDGDGEGDAAGDEDVEVQRAIKESEEHHQMTEDERQREEETVMRYVMRQSKAEEELRLKRMGTGNEPGETGSVENKGGSGKGKGREMAQESP